MAVLFLGDVAELFEQRQIDVRLDVALRSGIAVPIPGAAEVAALLDDANVFDARFAQTRASEQAAEPAADHNDLDFIEKGHTVDGCVDIRIFDVVRESVPHLDVLLVTFDAQALVPFVAVFLS